MAKMPTFSLPGTDGATHSAKSLAGAPYVLYFYPKDMTPAAPLSRVIFAITKPA